MVTIGFGACSTPPAPRFHTLLPLDPPVRAGSGGVQAARVAIVLEPIRIPVQVDQPQWLVRLADGAVVPLEQERWASPLRDEFHAAILERLIDRYGASDSHVAAGSSSPVRIVVNVRRFDSIVGREVRIEGSLAIGRSGSSASCEWQVSEPAHGGYASLDLAQQRAVQRLADAIGADLALVAGGGTPHCEIPAGS